MTVELKNNITANKIRDFWFNKENPDVEFVDNRVIDAEAIWKSTKNDSGRKCSIHPTILADFTNLPFAS